MDEVPPKLPSIEEEFAALEAELKKIAALPAETPEQRNALLLTLESFREDWRNKMRAGPDAPEWRRAVDDGIDRALEGLSLDLSRKSGGEVKIDNALVQRHLEPLFFILADGLRKNFVQKFSKKPPPGAPPQKVDATDVAGLLVTLFGPKPKK